MKKLFIAALVLACSLTLLLTGCNAQKDKNYIDEVSAYKAPDGSALFKNTNDQAYAQTVVHDIIMEHFAAALPDGKESKKAIFIGYDGCRADALQFASDQPDGKSGLLAVRAMGTLVFSYAGGPEGMDQATSTAPGWASLLTGKWAKGNGGHEVSDNGMFKNADVETCLTKLAKTGNYSSSFTTSWREHQKLTYFYDIESAIINGTDVTYTQAEDDQAVYYDVLKRVSGQPIYEDMDTDVVFLTLEGTDHAGHSKGFGAKHETYKEGFLEEDLYAYQIIKTIESRPDYDSEDWLFVISTDHGGNGKGHGKQSVYERTTWIATNKPEYLK